ncbi:MAG TPA: methyl-accepting chemotaxis protein, partial [bacterium]|nr:methyl-accepting chemotaxis protein [bacterium]
GLLAKNKENVDNLIANILSAAQAATESAKNIKELENRTRMIDKIVEQIVIVTIQTNMLAVNGSIEAARAGEYGRGFSVVAADIRALATDSAENADKIKDMVRAIQYQISTVANDIENVAKITYMQVENSKKSTTNLLTIEKEIVNVEELSKGIQENAEESLKALKEAKTAVDQISIAAKETEKAAVEAQQAASEAKKALQEISTAIEDIASQADEMQNSAVV